MSTKINNKSFSIIARDLFPRFILKSKIQNPKSTYPSGFTLVEVAVIMPLVMLVIGGLVGAILAMTNNVLITRADNTLVFNIQDALDKIEADVEISGGYLATNNVPIGQGQGYDNNVGPFNNLEESQKTVLILNSYATTTSPTGASRSLVYKSVAGSCANSTTPLMYNIVYFTDSDNVLWRRVIMPSNYLTDLLLPSDCDKKPWQRPSCNAITAGTICKSKDERLLSGVEIFSVKYLDALDSEINQDSLTPKTRQDLIYPDAKSIKVTIKATGKVGGKTFSETGTIRASGPNNNISS